MTVVMAVLHRTQFVSMQMGSLLTVRLTFIIKFHLAEDLPFQTLNQLPRAANLPMLTPFKGTLMVKLDFIMTLMVRDCT